MTNGNAKERPGRVLLMKRLMIAFFIVGMIFPLLLCILLFIKVGKLESELRRLETNGSASNSETAVLSDQILEDEPVEVFSQDDMKLFEKISLKDASEADAQTKVYLTFDDGPSLMTEKVLDVLKEYDVKATFFVIGKTEPGYEAIYQRIVDEGHTLGMHSFSHKYHEIYASDEAFWQDFGQIQEFLYDITEVWPRFYRFPGGSSNLVSKLDMKQLTQELYEQDIYYLDWNVSGCDATGENLSARQIADNVINNVGRYETAVVLLHDTNSKKATVEALPMIIEELQKNEQVVFLPADDDMQLVQHLTVANE